ncbi:MAG: AtpZ/AtpI family protein [Alphaproteobacteria bacterium]|nr:AtpZ/AtpI family protein [Alphaproteobacteria bacterium]
MKKLPQDISELDKRIRAAKNKKEKQPKHASARWVVFLQNAFRMSIEFVSPIFIGICVGYILDKWFDTRVIFMLIMAIFGCAAGVLNLYRAAQSMEKDLNGSK